MRRQLRLFATILSLICIADGARALTIYGESFTGQTGTGVSATGGQNTGNGETWSMDASGATLGQNYFWIFPLGEDYFEVVDAGGNDHMEARDVDGVVYWLSPIVNISAYSNLNLSVSFGESGTLEVADFINVEYSLDGGANFALIADINGLGSLTSSLNGDFTSTILSEGLADGTAFQLRISLRNDADFEYLFFDDILLTGDRIPGVPLPAGGLLLAGAVGLLVRRRRRA